VNSQQIVHISWLVFFLGVDVDDDRFASIGVRNGLFELVYFAETHCQKQKEDQLFFLFEVKLGVCSGHHGPICRQCLRNKHLKQLGVLVQSDNCVTRLLMKQFMLLRYGFFLLAEGEH
jgi:hypothetical protein